MGEIYRGNEKLKLAGTEIAYTQPQLVEYMKCMNDPFYFIDNYIKIEDADTHEVIPFKLYSYQREILEALHHNRFIVVKLSRRAGKCQNINTKVTVRNKKTGIIETLTLGEIFARAKNNLSTDIK